MIVDTNDRLLCEGGTGGSGGRGLSLDGEFIRSARHLKQKAEG